MKTRISFISLVIFSIFAFIDCTPRYGLARSVSVKENPFSGAIETTATMGDQVTEEQLTGIKAIHDTQLQLAYELRKQETEITKKAQETGLAETVIKWAAGLVAFVVFVALKGSRKERRQEDSPEATKIEPEPRKPSMAKEVIQVVERRMK